MAAGVLPGPHGGRGRCGEMNMQEASQGGASSGFRKSALGTFSRYCTHSLVGSQVTLPAVRSCKEAILQAKSPENRRACRRFSIDSLPTAIYCIGMRTFFDKLRKHPKEVLPFVLDVYFALRRTRRYDMIEKAEVPLDRSRNMLHNKQVKRFSALNQQNGGHPHDRHHRLRHGQFAQRPEGI